MTGAPRDLAQARLTIDLGALRRNWRALAALASPGRCGAVIKADGYGIGIERAAVVLGAEGCRDFFVAQPDEGLRARSALRRAGRDSTIYALNGLAASSVAARACAEEDVTPLIGTEGDLRLWREQAERLGRRMPLALMIDTGMNRLGFDWRSPQALAARLGGSTCFDLRLIASHFVSSERREDPLNALQIARFEQARAAFPGVSASLANSSGIFLPQRPALDLARPGYALYGGNPCPGEANPMAPVVRLRARILQLREIGPGETVGYDAQWTARRPTRLAVLGLGYADGLPRNSMATDFAKGGEAIVGGARCPFAGRVSMDLTTIDVTDAPETLAVPGAEAELLGEQITIDDLGARSQTIGYEILTNLGRRYARDYVGE